MNNEQVINFYRMLKLSNISDKDIKKNMGRLNRFHEACSYQIDDGRIIIYINELKEQFEPETVRKHIITIKRFLKFIDYPSTELIEPPRVPKRAESYSKTAECENANRGD